MVDTINHIALSWWSWMAAMFWQVSLLIILIACLDTIIKRWAWPKLRYALWLLVLLKLVLPPGISMPGSFTARLQPVTGRIVDSMTRERHIVFEEPPTEMKYGHYAIVPAVISSPARTTVVTPPPERAFGDYAVEILADEPAPSVKPVWQSYALVIWLFGMAVLGFWLISRLYRLRKGQPQSGTAYSIPQSFHNMMLRCARQLRLRRVPRIVVTKKVVCPAVFGVFRPVLLMPKGYLGKLSRKDAEHMLLHELAHIKRGDPIVHSFYLLLQIVYWFNPLLWLARRQLIHLRELCCDATVASLLKNKTCEYRETLIDVARRFLTRPVEPGMGLLGLFEDTNRLLVRLSWLEKKTWRYQKMKNIIVITIVTLMTAFVLPMAVGQEAPSDEDYFVGTDLSGKASSLGSKDIEAEAKLTKDRKKLTENMKALEIEIKQLKEKDQLMKEMQALKVQLEKLEIEKQNLRKELATLEKSRMTAEKSKEQASKVAKKAKDVKDKADKYSADAKKWKKWAEQWTNSEEFKQWQKDVEKWSQQIQQLHQSNGMHNWAVDPDKKEEFKKWHQEMQQWQNSGEFKQWQEQMHQWQSKMKDLDWHKQMQLNTDANADADEDSEPMEIPTIHPMPPMPEMLAIPPMPEMPAMPPMPPMPEDSTVSVNVAAPVVPQPNVIVTPKSVPSVTVVPKVEVPVGVTVPVVTTPGSRLTTPTKQKGVKIEKNEDKEFIATKEMEFTTKVEPGTPFIVRNKVGKIILIPSEDRNCTVKAVIRATADTADQAQELIQQVSMNAHTSREKFYFEPVKSGDDSWEGLNVDLYVTVPSGVAPDISTDVGSIEINNLKERIKGLTNVGSIKVANVMGDIQLTTKVGDIEFVAHKDLSAKIQATTKVGSIKSELPLEISTKDFTSSMARGTVGSGEKNIRLTTEVGKIRITKQSQKSSSDSFEQSISLNKIAQNSAGTGKTAAAQLSSTVELSAGDVVRTVRSINESEEGNRHVIKRVEMMKMPLSPGAVLEVSNEDGSITVVGSDTDKCQVDSTFTIKAPTAEAARGLSKKVSLDMTPTSKGLSLKVDHPKNTPQNHSYQVDLQIVVPKNTNLKLSNEDGNIQVKDIEGQIQIGVEDGDILCENVTADVRLASEDGNISIIKSRLSKVNIRKEDGNVKCDGIRGDCDILVEDGDVVISYAEDMSENCTCIVRGEDGNVSISRGTFAQCQIKRESGKIDCDKVRGNLDFKLEDGQVDVDYADNVPENCTINVQLEDGSVRLSAPGKMFPADSPSKAKKMGDGAQWKTKIETSGGSRTVNLTTDEGSIKVEKR